MTFPDPAIDRFVSQLRAHYHAVGLPNADKQADDYVNAIAACAARPSATRPALLRVRLPAARAKKAPAGKLV